MTSPAVNNDCGLLRAIVTIELRIASRARGATVVLIQNVKALRTRATPRTGRQTRSRLVPQARKATISLSADIRPKTSRTAVRNAHGTVKVKENGST